MRYLHFCDCGPFIHCGSPIVHMTCQSCGDEYIGPDCDVTRPLPVTRTPEGIILCRECVQKETEHRSLAASA